MVRGSLKEKENIKEEEDYIASELFYRRKKAEAKAEAVDSKANGNGIQRWDAWLGG